MKEFAGHNWTDPRRRKLSLVERLRRWLFGGRRISATAIRTAIEQERVRR